MMEMEKQKENLRENQKEMGMMVEMKEHKLHLEDYLCKILLVGTKLFQLHSQFH